MTMRLTTISVVTLISLVLPTLRAQPPPQPVLPKDAEVSDTAGDVWNIGRRTGNFYDQLDYQNPPGGPLFTHTPEVDARLGEGTYELLTAQYQDYNPTTGIAEVCGNECQARRNAFLDDMLNSWSMHVALTMMSKYDPRLAYPDGRREYLSDIWFTPYSRSGGRVLDSSGFEHVFLGEIRKNRAIGYHGWPKAYLDEPDDVMIYQQTNRICQPDILSFAMNYWRSRTKNTSMFMKTSPEVEMALYTLCFFSRPDQACDVRLGGYPVTIKTHTYNCNGRYPCVGGAYPVC